MDMSSVNETMKTYKDGNVVKVFDEQRSLYKYQLYKHDVESNFIKNTLGLFSDKDKLNILDVACGTGRMLDTVMLRKGITYNGLDTSKEMTSVLKNKAKKKNYPVNITISSALDMPFEDNTFDLVYSYHLLWHLDKKSQEKVISEMLRVAKPNGYIIFDILNKEFFWNYIKKIFGFTQTDGIHKMSYRQLIRKYSYKNIKIEKINDFPVKNDLVYSVINVFNYFRAFLPKNLYHMSYFRIKK